MHESIPTREDVTFPIDDRRHALILAAYQSIAKKGFEGLRTREVAATVGIHSATLHHYFPTKEALIQGVIDYAVQRLIQATISSRGSARANRFVSGGVCPPDGGRTNPLPGVGGICPPCPA